MATQIPKLITNVEPYFRYEGEANATTQDQFQGFLKNEHSVLAVLTKGIWQPTTAYEIGDIIKSPNMPKGFHAIAQTKGNSGANEPTWGDGTTNVSDGTVSWKLSKGDITVNGVGADSNGNIQINNIANATHANKADLATKATNADNATKATQDSAGQTINSTYIKDVTGVDGAIKVTKGNGISNTISIAPKYPSWYTDRGDGSDGDFIPSKNTTISGIKNYKKVEIKSGITIKVDRVCFIKCQNTFINQGIITANGMDGNYKSPLPVSDGSYGGGSGGAGGHGKTEGGGPGGIIPKNPYQLITSQIGIGANGGQGGDSSAVAEGGGSIIIIADTIQNSGSITADGGIGNDSDKGGFGGGFAGGGGGGGGGTITLVANTITNNGITTANGGKGGKSGGYGAGADGQNGTVTIKKLR